MARVARDVVEKIWDYVKKYMSQQDRETLKPWYKYTIELEADIKAMTAKLQTSLLRDTSPTMTKEEKLQLQSRKLKEHLSQPFKGETLGQRLAEMDHKQQRDSNLWRQTLEWNSLTEEHANEIIKTFREAMKKNES